jgi:hypothetical protein
MSGVAFRLLCVGMASAEFDRSLYVNKTEYYLENLALNSSILPHIERWKDEPFGIQNFDVQISEATARFFLASNSPQNRAQSLYGLENSLGGMIKPCPGICLAARSDGTFFYSSQCLALWQSPSSVAEYMGTFMGMFGAFIGAISEQWSWTRARKDEFVANLTSDLAGTVGPIKSGTDFADVPDRTVADTILIGANFPSSTFGIADYMEGGAELLAGVRKDTLDPDSNATICGPGMHVVRQQEYAGTVGDARDSSSEEAHIQQLYAAVIADPPDSYDASINWALGVKRNFYDSSGALLDTVPPLVILWQCAASHGPDTHSAFPVDTASRCYLLGIVDEDEALLYNFSAYIKPAPSSPPPAPPSSPPDAPGEVMMQLTASGDVTDYDPSKKTAIATAVAAIVTGATVTDVSVVVHAGSVIIDVVVTVPSSSTASTVLSELTASLSDPTAATTALGVTVTAVVLPPSASGVQGDPHLRFAHGGTADFRGKNNTNYNLLSAPGYSFASRTVDATFLLPAPRLVYGSFFVNASWRIRGTNGKEYSVESDAQQTGFVVRDAADGRIIVNHTLIWTTWWHEGIRVMHKQSTILVRANGWEVNATRHPIYNKVEGPSSWRYDFTIRPLDGNTGMEQPHGKASATCFPHGIIGQHWDGDKFGTPGARDAYDKTVVHTKAMAEGSIEGSASDYVVNDHIDKFRFGRFHKNTTDVCLPRDTSKLNRSVSNMLDDVASTSDE